MVEIPALPKPLRYVPEHGQAWKDWRDKATLYRMRIREECERDQNIRNLTVNLAADDPAYGMLLFGCTYEPRDRPGRRKGSYPMIPYAFQVRMIRWIEHVLSIEPESPEAQLGRMDGVVEKAREMAGSYTFCYVMAHHWQFDDGFTGLLTSYRAEDVKNGFDPGTLWFKVVSNLGMDERLAEYADMEVAGHVEHVPVRSPRWLIPEGFLPKIHDKGMVLAHPFKLNTIVGTATTEKIGTGKRVTMALIDEAAKFPEFRRAYENLGPVTDHRFPVSSADQRYGAGFRYLAKAAEDALTYGRSGPSFLRLRIEEHPLQDDIAQEASKARYSGVPGAREAWAREYGLDYDEGAGNLIYPSAAKIVPKPITVDLSYQTLYFSIDPGIRDKTAFHVWTYNEHLDRYALVLSYANSGKGADFYASLVMAAPMNQHYAYNEDELRVVDFFEDYGRRIKAFVGDPAGKAKVGGREGKLTSFYDDFREATHLLSDGHRAIAIYSSDKKEYKRTPWRIRSLRWLLDRLEVQNAPDTILTLRAIQEHHWKAVDEIGELVTVPTEPVHGWGSDRVTACEYFAASRQTDATIQENGIARATVVSPSGKKKPTSYKHGVYRG